MSYRRLDELGGIQWPCWDEEHPGEQFLHAPAVGGAGARAQPAPFNVVEHEPPVDELSDEFPIRLTTGRRLDSYNTGVQSGGYSSPLRRGESLDLSPEDATRLGVADGRAGAASARAAARSRRRCGSTTRCGPGWPS